MGLKNRGGTGPTLYERLNSRSIPHLSSTALDLVQARCIGEGSSNKFMVGPKKIDTQKASQGGWGYPGPSDLDLGRLEIFSHPKGGNTSFLVLISDGSQ